MYDPTDTLERKGQVLEFYQTFSGAQVSFKAFLETYTENFQCRWNGQTVLGRPDPIQTYQGTQRNINLSWKIPAFSLQDSIGNLQKTSTLTRMLYPEYSRVDSASTISKGPLVKIKFANLIFDASRGFDGDVRTCGLLGVINSLQWNPNIKEGFFDPVNKLYPKLITLTIGFSVLHQHTLGWEKAEAIAVGANRQRRIIGRQADSVEGTLAGFDKIDKINDRREDFAENAAPSWGADASLFPWSAGSQRGSTAFIGDFDTGEAIQEVAINEILGGND